MTKKLLDHWPFILLILTLGIYLGAKAIPENSWDGWRVGSAQTLLSIKHWTEDGFLKNYLLFLPQGYSKTVRYFDDPELRQHARGIATGGFIGKRLYYTHYPPGYLLPTAFLMKLGVENRFWFRFLEILFSISGLVFLYWFLHIISNRTTALLGTVFYGISTIFLDYADSLANQPIDDLLRLAIIALSVYALSSPLKKGLEIIIWIIFFAASVASYDSAFFILAWLIGLDLIILRKINLKKWFIWMLAPISGFAIQILQNYFYLGWHNMVLDFYGAFKTGIIGSRKDFFISHLRRLIEPFGWFFGVKWYLGIIISILGIWCLKMAKKYLNSEILDIRYLYLALAATLFHFLLFPSLFFYQGRLAAIFAALLIGSLMAISVKEIVQLSKSNTSIQRWIVVLGITVFASVLWFIQADRTYAYIKQWPNNVWPAEKIDFDRKIKNLFAGDKVIFQLLGADREISGPDRYPMTASEEEYYVGTPILGFTNINDLIRDLNYLKKRSEFSFNAIIIADQKETIEKIKLKLKPKEPDIKIDDKFILIK